MKGPWMLCASCDEYHAPENVEVDEYPLVYYTRWGSLIEKILDKTGETPVGICCYCTGPCYYAAGRISKWTRVLNTIEEAADRTNPEWKAGALDSIYQVCLDSPAIVVPLIWNQYKRTHGEFAITGTSCLAVLSVLLKQAIEYDWCSSSPYMAKWKRRVGSKKCGTHTMNIYRSSLHTGHQSFDEWRMAHIGANLKYLDQQD